MISVSEIEKAIKENKYLTTKNSCPICLGDARYWLYKSNFTIRIACEKCAKSKSFDVSNDFIRELDAQEVFTLKCLI